MYKIGFVFSEILWFLETEIDFVCYQEILIPINKYFLGYQRQPKFCGGVTWTGNCLCLSKELECSYFGFLKGVNN